MIKKILVLSILLANQTFAQDSKIKFSTIESPKEFIDYWKISKEQLTTYENYMKVAGKYRHTQVNPLVVLSMISESEEDREYFATKAASYESKMVGREIESSWLISQSMEKQGLNDSLSQLAQRLTGINTDDYVPAEVKQVWKKDDDLVILVDKVCVEMNCLKYFKAQLKVVPQNIKKTLVYQLPKDQALEAEFNNMAKPLIDEFSMQVKRYDSIEFNYLDGLKNQMAQVRNNKIIKKF